MAKIGAVIIRECCYLSVLMLHLFSNQFSVQGKATFHAYVSVISFVLCVYSFHYSQSNYEI